MTLGAVTLKNFTVFEDATFDLCPGVNVLIGANATGKTHAMKAMYAALRGATPDAEPPTGAFNYKKKIEAVFLPQDTDSRRLVRRTGSVQAKTSVLQLRDLSGGSIKLTLSSEQRSLSAENSTNPPSGALYIPSREVLSMYEGFIPAYLNRELSFDETFFDLCVALNANVLRGDKAEQVASLVQQLETILGGKVVLDGNRFYVQPASGEPVEAHLVAEGLRKIATVVRLVANGAIAPGTIVFWDEPETNLNPRLITRVVDVLVELARHGVQLVIATHDYLLTRQLSILAEYRRVPPGTVRFFGLARDEADGPVRVAAGDVLADLDENPIADEFARQYDFERQLFDSSQGG